MAISSNAVIKDLLQTKLQHVDSANIIEVATCIEKHLFDKKIKFPQLEYAASYLFSYINDKKHISFLDKIQVNKLLGAYPITGKILQFRLQKSRQEVFNKAEEYIIFGDEWYVCDIIAERVFGHALLFFFDETILKLKSYSNHSNPWMIRSIGVATHYAVKKGIHKSQVEKLLEILLPLNNIKGFHVKKGIAWGIKTIAKFHPEIIYANEVQIQKLQGGNKWFFSGMMTGLRIHEKNKN